MMLRPTLRTLTLFGLLLASASIAVAESVEFRLTLRAPVQELFIHLAGPLDVDAAEPRLLMDGETVAPPIRTEAGAWLWRVTPDATTITFNLDVDGAGLLDSSMLSLATRGASGVIPLSGDVSLETWHHLLEGLSEGFGEVPGDRDEEDSGAQARLLWNLDGSAGIMGVNVMEGSVAEARFGVRAQVDYSDGETSFALAADRNAIFRTVASEWSLQGAWTDPLTLRFPGLAQRADPPLRSTDGVAFRYETPILRASYAAETVRIPAVNASTFLDAASVSLAASEDATVSFVTGFIAPSRIVQTLTPDGTRIYNLDGTPTPGSEVVTRIVTSEEGDVIEETTLEAGQDYVIDPLEQTLELRRPEWPRTLQGDLVTINVVYTSPDLPRTVPVVGAGLSTTVDDWLLEVGYGYLPMSQSAEGMQRRYGVRAVRADQALEARWESVREEEGTSLATTVVRASQMEVFGAQASVEVTGLTGSRTRIAVDSMLDWQAEGNRIRLEGALERAEFPQVRLSGTRELSAEWRVQGAFEVKDDAVEVSAGTELSNQPWFGGLNLRYGGKDDALRLQANGGYVGDGWRVELDHGQPVTIDEDSHTTLSLQGDVRGLMVRSDVRHTWGGDTLAVFGVEQAVADGQMTLEWVAPLTSGEANHMRWGLMSPFELTPDISVDAYLGAEGDLIAGTLTYATSLRARYDQPHLWASTSIDLSWNERWKADVGVALGSLLGSYQDHALDVDLRWGLAPTARIRASASYAHHAADYSVLAYQRIDAQPSGALTTGELEGEVAGAWRALDGLRLRPAFAYRWNLEDDASFVAQGGLAAMVRIAERIDVGGAVYQTLQPSQNVVAPAFGAEVSFELLQGIYLVTGYTTGTGISLLPGSTPGWHARLDFGVGSP